MLPTNISTDAAVVQSISAPPAIRETGRRRANFAVIDLDFPIRAGIVARMNRKEINKAGRVSRPGFLAAVIKQARPEVGSTHPCPFSHLHLF
jgi:hypothetical protein